MVFAAVRTHFPRKTTACLVDGTAINKQTFKYNNEHSFLRSGRLVESLEQSPSVRAAGVRIHKRVRVFVLFWFFFFHSFPFFSFFFFCIGNYCKRKGNSSNKRGTPLLGLAKSIY